MNRNIHNIYYRMLTGFSPFKVEYGGRKSWFWGSRSIAYCPLRFMGSEFGFWEKYGI